MPEIVLNGQRLQVPEDKPLLEIVRGEGIRVPSLCYHPALSPAGVCRLCAVEVKLPGKDARIRLSCALRVKEGMEIRTDSAAVSDARVAAFQRLVQYAPESKVIRSMAAEYGIDLGPAPDECIRCRLCTRLCKEIVAAGALVMKKVGGVDMIMPAEGNRCIGCGTCVNICPTGAIKLKDEGFFRTISIRDEVIGHNPLVRCEACGNLFATRKFLSRVEKTTDAHPHVKAHHQYCPTCAKLLSDRIQSVSPIKNGQPLQNAMAVETVAPIQNAMAVKTVKPPENGGNL